MRRRSRGDGNLEHQKNGDRCTKIFNQPPTSTHLLEHSLGTSRTLNVSCHVDLHPFSHRDEHFTVGFNGAVVTGLNSTVGVASTGGICSVVSIGSIISIDSFINVGCIVGIGFIAGVDSTATRCSVAGIGSNAGVISVRVVGSSVSTAWVFGASLDGEIEVFMSTGTYARNSEH